MSKPQKVVVVTGASRGIGAEVVKAFRKLDHRIVATSRSIKQSDDENILSIAGDIGDPTTAQRVISEGVARFGRIDTLVNNADRPCPDVRFRGPVPAAGTSGSERSGQRQGGGNGDDPAS